jgi:hypothetical protein
MRGMKICVCGANALSSRKVEYVCTAFADAKVKLVG